MKNIKHYLPAVLCALLAGAGLVCVNYTRQSALADGASVWQQVLFSCSILLTLAGIVGFLAAILPSRQTKPTTREMTLAALFAALCYIGFTFFKIDIPVGSEKTAFHLGNVFCVLAALFLGGLWGGMAGAVGMTIADLTTGYITSAPKTFLLKLCIGVITGFVAHRVLKLRQKNDSRAATVAAGISSFCGMAFNVVADPLVGYYYKTYVLGVPQQAANIWAKMGAVTTLVNAIVAVIAATIFYTALAPALKKAGFHSNNT
jgi:uncharacterized membrane protein